MGSKHERGIALVIVLWVGLLVVAIAAAFIADTRSSTQMARNFLDNAEARAMADGGVHLAMFELLRPDSPLPWRKDGKMHSHTVPGGALAIMVEDEGGKIDLNNANDELLEGLFISAGLGGESAGSLLNAIDNFRAGEEERSRQQEAIEIPDQEIQTNVQRMMRTSRRNRRAAGNVRSNRGRRSVQAFYSLDSFGQVQGVTPKLQARLQPALTVFGSRGVDYMTAPRHVLLAVPGITEQAVDAFIAGRSGDDPEGSLENFLEEGQAREHFQEGDGNTLTVKVLARSNNGAQFLRIAVVELTGQDEQPFVIREWREGDTLTDRSGLSLEASQEVQDGGPT